MRFDPVDITPTGYDVTCATCGQTDGPYRGARDRRILLAGWQRVPDLNAWQNGRWQPGHEWSWRCARCYVPWLRACRAMYRMPAAQETGV